MVSNLRFIKIFIWVLSFVSSINQLSCATTESIAHHSYNVHKINESFYVGHMTKDDTKLWLVMERIDSRTLPLWKRYAFVQSNPRAAFGIKDYVDEKTGKPLQKYSPADGSAHFQLVLDEVDTNLNEIWVAYITKTERPEPISDNMRSYSANDLDSFIEKGQGHDFARNILMSVTVASSPRALITMGIARSIEGVFSKERGLSMDLHSFAAKVMLLRNPERRYMVNAPVFGMEKILLEAVPANSVYVGTREMHQVMQDRANVTLEEFTKTHAEQLQGKDMSGIYHEFFYFKSPYDRSLYRYGIKPEVTTEAAERFLAYLNAHPPLLSVDEEWRINEKFTLYDKDAPNKPWLRADKSNQDYDWMFTGPYQPAKRTTTHFIVVDLKKSG